MTIKVDDLPLVLCGPILRRVDEQSVSVFVALKEERWVHIRLYAGYVSHDPDNVDSSIYSSEGNKKQTICLGKNLHVAVVTLNIIPPAKLVPDNLYSYNLYFDSDEGADDDYSLSRKELSLLTDKKFGSSIDNNEYRLGFEPGKLPSFSLPPKDFNKLNILQASCRKPHGEGDDMLAEMDELIKNSYADAAKRPHLLLFHGDQIYADDVSPILLKLLFDTSKELLGWHESFPGTGDPLFESYNGTFIEDPNDANAKLLVENLKNLENLADPDPILSVEDVITTLKKLSVQINGFQFHSSINKNIAAKKRLQQQLKSFKNEVVVLTDQIDTNPPDDLTSEEVSSVISLSTKILNWLKTTMGTNNLSKENLSNLNNTIFGDISSSFPWGQIGIKGEQSYIPSRISPPQREFEIKQFAKFTSDEMSAHLMFLGEFYMMYLFVWSDVLWPKDASGNIVLPLYSDAVPNYSFLGAKSKSHLKKISKITKKFAESLPQVRRVLANVPVLMMFDDHEVTDDWNINEDWVTTVNAAPMGKPIIRNALAAYAIFQDWGNQPNDYKQKEEDPPQPQPAGATILDNLTAPFDSNNNITPPPAVLTVSTDENLFKLFGLGQDLEKLEEPIDPITNPQPEPKYRIVPHEGRKRWDWVYNPYQDQDDNIFQIISLDTRTHRGFPTDEWAAIGFSQSYKEAIEGEPLTVLGRIGPVALIQPIELIKQLDDKLEDNIFNIVLSPAPVFGLPIIEDVVQRFFTLKNSPEYADFESWQGNPLSFEQLVNIFKSRDANILLLSGDVHYAYSNQLEFINEDSQGNSSTSKITQLCSSSLKNETAMTRVLGLLGRSSTAQEIGMVALGSIIFVDWVEFGKSLLAQIHEFEESIERLNMDGGNLVPWWNQTGTLIPLSEGSSITYYLKLKDSMLLDIRVPLGIFAAGEGMGNYMFRNLFENEGGAGIAISADGSFKTKFMKDYRHAKGKRGSVNADLGLPTYPDNNPSDFQLEKSSEVVGYNNFGLIKFESDENDETKHKKTIHHLVWRVHTHQYKTLNNLANTKHTPLPHWETVKKNTVALALREYRWWNPEGEPKIVETDLIARTRLNHYYQSASLDLVWNADDTNLIWSAAFISYIMKESGAGGFFEYSVRHIDYIRAAKSNKEEGNNDNPFHLYKVEDAIPEVGDIICRWRGLPPGYSYVDVEVEAESFRPSHCEIVVKIIDMTITTIGGNASHSVGDDSLDLTDSGDGLRIKDHADKKIFGIIKFITEVS